MCVCVNIYMHIYKTSIKSTTVCSSKFYGAFLKDWHDATKAKKLIDFVNIAVIFLELHWTKSCPNTNRELIKKSQSNKSNIINISSSIVSSSNKGKESFIHV